MISLGFLSMIVAGLAMGVLHAFDPDHLLTISSLGAQAGRPGTVWRYALSWGIGHGGMLVSAALALLLFDVPMPDTLPQGAEWLVGVIMIAAGGSLALALWHGRGNRRSPSSLRAKAPFLIGMVHGTAGSAAVFALLPIGLLSPMQGVAYVLVFSAGVLTGMMGFGFGFDRLTQALALRAHAFDAPLRGGVAALAITMGSYWLVSA
jgi:hypothetical protein